MNMPNNVDEMQQLRKDSMDAATKSFGAMSKCFQAIATEVANYSKRSLEDHTAAMEKLMTAQSPEKAMEVQTEYVKSAYEAFVGQATKIAELYADLGKECYKPFVGIIGKKTSMS
jgi:phasin family protein